jgi:hypothetical protein
MQVNRASASNMRSGSVRTDATGVAMASAPLSGVAPISAAENGLSDEPPPPPFTQFLPEEDDAPERLIDAIDPAMAYRAASSMLRRQGMVGLLLNRNA